MLVEGSDLLRADLYSDFLTDDQARVQKRGRVAPGRRARRPHARRRRSRARRGVRGEPGVAAPRFGARGHRHPRAGHRARVPPLGHQPAQRLRLRDRHRTHDPRPARHRRARRRWRGARWRSCTGRRSDQRVTTLVHANEDAVFRDSKVGMANNIAIALAVVLALVAALVARRRRRGDGPRCASSRSRCSGFLFATYAGRAAALRAQRQLGRVPRLPRGGGAGLRRRVPAARRAQVRTARSRSRSRSPWWCTCSTCSRARGSS